MDTRAHRQAIKWPAVKVAMRMDLWPTKMTAESSIVACPTAKEASASTSSVVAMERFGMRKFWAAIMPGRLREAVGLDRLCRTIISKRARRLTPIKRHRLEAVTVLAAVHPQARQVVRQIRQRHHHQVRKIASHRQHKVQAVTNNPRRHRPITNLKVVLLTATSRTLVVQIQATKVKDQIIKQMDHQAVIIIIRQDLPTIIKHRAHRIITKTQIN